MNPLLSQAFLVPFDQIRAEHVVPAMREALERAEADLGAITTLTGERSYANTVAALDDLIERFTRPWKVATHLTAVATTPELRAAYNEVLPEVSRFDAKLPLNPALWQALKAYAATPEAQALGGVRKRHLSRTLRDFVRAGADLPDDEKRQVEAIKVELSRLQTRFAENTLDATNVFELIVSDEGDLAGLPDSVRAQAKASAAAKGVDGWRFTLQGPSYMPFMQYADNRALREQLYNAYVSRASTGPHDNTPLIPRILELRLDLAKRLGYPTFADYRLEPNMARTAEVALEFVTDLTRRTNPTFAREVETLTQFAQTLGVETLQAWDVPYLIERLRQSRHQFDEEALRPYFPLEGVLTGMFDIAGELFGIRVRERRIAEVWHPDVRFYEVYDDTETLLGGFYADWYPREDKRGGAWMNALITGGPREGSFAPHLGLMVGNFTPPQEGRTACLTHREVETTFHEFGHLLHHLLSRVEVAARAGTKVARDWVELPSQIMENWTWEREALDRFAHHIDTGAPLPNERYTRLLATRTFMAANAQMRQLSFAMVDLALHTHYHTDPDTDPLVYAQRVMEPYTIRPEFAHTHFINAFTHVFTGGYAAGYYAYKWSEVLDADAFGRFKTEGLFDRATGRAFVDAVLSRGDSADPAELFREFMGRDPDPTALLRRTLADTIPTDTIQGD